MKTQKCVEYDSLYFIEKSEMKEMCPQCSHQIYGYENCKHQFKNNRCIFCF